MNWMPTKTPVHPTPIMDRHQIHFIVVYPRHPLSVPLSYGYFFFPFRFLLLPPDGWVPEALACPSESVDFSSSSKSSLESVLGVAFPGSDESSSSSSSPSPSNSSSESSPALLARRRPATALYAQAGRR